MMPALGTVAQRGSGWWLASLPGWMAHRPTMALLVASLGVVLILWEFHRPGWVLPGAGGAGLLLLGEYGLALEPLRGWAVGLLVPAVLCLLLPWRRPEYTAVVVPGVIALCAALAFLVRGQGAAWTLTAVGDGMVLGVACGLLATVAGWARRAKARTRARRGSAGEESRSWERWE